MRHRHWLAALLAAAALAPLPATAADTIKIGFSMPLSGPAAVYGVPVTKGAALAVADINAKGGVLARKLELLPRDSKANADEAVRLARGSMIQDIGFASDSPLEEAVTSEPVSVCENSLLAANLQGISTHAT
jgi:branched-chain amino acid transport system substrate-binding protein